VTFQAHDFFAEQPVHGADIYFLKQVLHDWPDRDCERIVRALVPALKPGARIVLCEGVVPPMEGPGSEGWALLPQTARGLLAAADLQMLVLLNAKQRSVPDFMTLFGRADARLQLGKMYFPPESPFGLLEFVFKG
jgi:hypothetical protein